MNQALSIRLADAEDAESLIMLNHEFNRIQMPIVEQGIQGRPVLELTAIENHSQEV